MTTSPVSDRILAAQIAGTVARYAHGGRLTAEEEAAAVAELRQVAAGRADLLAERAGISLGFGERQPGQARYRQIADLCVAAGADRTLIGRWIPIGRERANVAAVVPHGGQPSTG